MGPTPCPGLSRRRGFMAARGTRPPHRLCREEAGPARRQRLLKGKATGTAGLRPRRHLLPQPASGGTFCQFTFPSCNLFKGINNLIPPWREQRARRPVPWAVCPHGGSQPWPCAGPGRVCEELCGPSRVRHRRARKDRHRVIAHRAGTRSRQSHRDRKWGGDTRRWGGGRRRGAGADRVHAWEAENLLETVEATLLAVRNVAQVHSW